jgi:hypothetical protein
MLDLFGANNSSPCVPIALGRFLPMLPSQIKALRTLVASLQAELMSLRVTLQTSTVNYIAALRDASEKRNKQVGEIPRVIASAIETAAADVPQYEKTQRGKEYGLQRRIFWAALVAGIAAAIYAWFAYETLQTMQDQTRLAAKSLLEAENSVETSQDQVDRTMRQMYVQTVAQVDAAKAARNAIKQAHEQATLDQRPWLAFKEITCEECKTQLLPVGERRLLYMPITIKGLKGVIVNTGKTPAEDVVVLFRLHWGSMVLRPIDECRLNGKLTCEPPPNFELRNFRAEYAPPMPDIPILPTNLGVVPPGQTGAITFKETRPKARR